MEEYKSNLPYRLAYVTWVSLDEVELGKIIDTLKTQFKITVLSTEFFYCNQIILKSRYLDENQYALIKAGFIKAGFTFTFISNIGMYNSYVLDYSFWVKMIFDEQKRQELEKMKQEIIMECSINDTKEPIPVKQLIKEDYKSKLAYKLAYACWISLDESVVSQLVKNYASRHQQLLYSRSMFVKFEEKKYPHVNTWIYENPFIKEGFVCDSIGDDGYNLDFSFWVDLVLSEKRDLEKIKQEIVAEWFCPGNKGAVIAEDDFNKKKFI